MDMNRIKRRQFLTATAGTTLYLGALGHGARAAKGIAPPPKATLGASGIETSRMALGTGMKGWKRQSDHTRMGFGKLVGLFQHCYDRGITFFDLADLYGSHVYFREALRSIPREKVTILTKLWWKYDSKNPTELPADFCKRSAHLNLDRFLHELDTDYIDIVLLHCLTKPDWAKEMAPYMEVLSKAKEKGKIKALGVSCHNFGAMQTAAELPWVDIMLSRLNPDGVKTDAKPEEVVKLLKKARANGKGIVGMKIYGEGQLVHKKDECMKYAQTNGSLDAMTIGAVSPEQVDENLSLMAKYPVPSA